MSVQIITDHKWKNLKYGYEVPAKIMSDQFDWVDDSDGEDFILYRKRWYHLGEFMPSTDTNPVMAQWHGVAADTYFSAVAIELSSDGEQYRIATIFS